MRLNIRAMAIAMGVLGGIAMFLVGLANLIWPGYGNQFLQLLASVYPGYKASGSGGDYIVGVLYALVDGGIFGLVLAWLYNRLLGASAAVAAEDTKRVHGHSPPVEPGA
jgi:hypothetical protein